MGLFDLLGDGIDWVGDNVLDPLTGGDDAAAANKAQQEAAKEASAAMLAEGQAQRDFLTQQSQRGIGYIDVAQGKSLGALDVSYADARRRLNEGRDSALESLYSGNQQALGDLGSAEAMARRDLSSGGNRLSDLYSGGLRSGFETDPGYRFRQQQGEQAIMRSAAARGGRLGGDTLKALSQYNQGLASDEYDRYAQRAIGMAQGADQSDMMRGGALANLAAGMGGQRAGLAIGLGQQQSGLHSGWGTNASNLASAHGSNLSNLYMSTAGNKANLGIGAATASANLTPAMMQAMGMPVQYAGSDLAAQAQSRGNLFNIGAGVGLGVLFSDERLKTNIQPVGDEIDDLLEKLEPYSFEYVSEQFGNGSHIGIMAQDLEKSKAGKGIVIETPQGKMLDMRKLAGVTIAAAVSERRKRLELESRIAALEARLG